MQLASGFMLPAIAVCRRTILCFHCLFEGKRLLVHQKGITISKFFLGKVYGQSITSEIMFYGWANLSLPLN